jgi:hypothetical protein
MGRPDKARGLGPLSVVRGSPPHGAPWYSRVPARLEPHHYGHGARIRAVLSPAETASSVGAADLVGFVVRGLRPRRRLRPWRLVCCRARGSSVSGW